MLTVPLFLFLAFIAAVLVKTKSIGGGALTLGIALGLTLASTAVGPPVLAAMNSGAASVVQTISATVGGTK